ncbi:MAG: PaaI family thioesterase [Lachnospiraceae bacterium]|nr:PaaI family thioesterase [Lachnospiraceae bacterium]
MRDLEEARNYFKDDRFATEASGIIIEAVDDGYAKCSMKIEDRHRNAVNQVMGGAIYTLADFVFAVATNTKEQWTVTTVSQISYIGTVKGDTLYAESRCIKDGRRTCFYEIEIKDDLGNLVAVVSTSGSHLEKK